MTERVDDVTVTSADVWHIIGRREATGSCCEAVEAEGRSCGTDGGGPGFIGRGAGVLPSCGRREVTASFEGAGEGACPSWGRQEGRSQHKSVSTRSRDSGVEHPPCSHAKKSTRGKVRNTCCFVCNGQLRDLLKELLLIKVFNFLYPAEKQQSRISDSENIMSIILPMLRKGCLRAHETYL